jgi:hypothetical protein
LMKTSYLGSNGFGGQQMRLAAAVHWPALHPGIGTFIRHSIHRDQCQNAQKCGRNIPCSNNLHVLRKLLTFQAIVREIQKYKVLCLGFTSSNDRAFHISQGKHNKAGRPMRRRRKCEIVWVRNGDDDNLEMRWALTNPKTCLYCFMHTTIM